MPEGGGDEELMADVHELEVAEWEAKEVIKAAIETETATWTATATETEIGTGPLPTHE
jgi:hypothetical protein